MEAYEVRNQTVRVIDDSISTPPASLPVSKGDVIKLIKAD